MNDLLASTQIKYMRKIPDFQSTIYQAGPLKFEG